LDELEMRLRELRNTKPEDMSNGLTDPVGYLQTLATFSEDLDELDEQAKAMKLQPHSELIVRELVHPSEWSQAIDDAEIHFSAFKKELMRKTSGSDEGCAIETQIQERLQLAFRKQYFTCTCVPRLLC
jgi:hypothetical protein